MNILFVIRVQLPNIIDLFVDRGGENFNWHRFLPFKCLQGRGGTGAVSVFEAPDEAESGPGDLRLRICIRVSDLVRDRFQMRLEAAPLPRLMTRIQEAESGPLEGGHGAASASNSPRTYFRRGSQEMFNFELGSMLNWVQC